MLVSLLRNLRCWVSVRPPSFPLWLLNGDRVVIDGRSFIHRGWPVRVRSEQELRAFFARDVASSPASSCVCVGNEATAESARAREGRSEQRDIRQ
jgi:hypothetical protein